MVERYTPDRRNALARRDAAKDAYYASRAPARRDAAKDASYANRPAPPARRQPPPPVEEFDESYGMDGASGPSIDARWGVVPGRQIIMRTVSQTIATATPAALLQTDPFTQADQNLLGGDRPLTSAIGSVIVSGTMPTGYDAQSLRLAVISSLVVEVLVQGQLQDTIPFDAFLDTQFQQRQLMMLLNFDPGAWGSVSFRFTSLGVLLPAPAANTTTIQVLVKCSFAPSSRRFRARQR